MMRVGVRTLLVAALGVALLATPGGAADLDAAGWWWRAQTGLLQPVPAPPTVPEDGLMVGGAPDGPTAVAALRFFLDDDETMPELTLVVEHERGGQTAALVACRSDEGWAPTQAGRWDGRPEADCDTGAVDGVRSEDGETWTFSLGALVRDGLVNVVIQQAPVEDGPRSVFELAFAAPTSESLTTAPAVDEGPAVDAPPTAEPPVAAAQDDGFAPPPGDGFVQDSSSVEPFDGTVEEPDFGAPQAAGAPEVADGDDVADPEVAGEEVTEVAAGAAAAPPGPAPVSDTRPDVRTLAMMVALLCLVGFVAMSEGAGRRLVAAGIGGRLGTPGGAAGGQPVVRGLGRFARERDGPAPKLF